jgi:hypothetical protein
MRDDDMMICRLLSRIRRSRILIAGLMGYKRLINKKQKSKNGRIKGREE